MIVQYGGFMHQNTCEKLKIKRKTFKNSWQIIYMISCKI